MNSTLAFGIAAVPSIVGLVEVTKQIGLPDRWAPVAAIVIGVAAGLAQTYGEHLPWLASAVTGASLGLAAVGLHGGTKATLGKSAAPSEAAPAREPTAIRTPWSGGEES